MKRSYEGRKSDFFFFPLILGSYLHVEKEDDDGRPYFRITANFILLVNFFSLASLTPPVCRPILGLVLYSWDRVRCRRRRPKCRIRSLYYRPTNRRHRGPDFRNFRWFLRYRILVAKIRKA